MKISGRFDNGESPSPDLNHLNPEFYLLKRRRKVVTAKTIQKVKEAMVKTWKSTRVELLSSKDTILDIFFGKSGCSTC